MSITLPYSSEDLSLEYRAEQRLLIGRWLKQATLEEMKKHYELLLASALTYDCRHWLLDVRRRVVNNTAALEWFGNEFTPRLSAAFAAPVHVAYFAMVTHDEAITTTELDTNIRRGSLLGMHYHYFNQEGECLAWLTQQL